MVELFQESPMLLLFIVAALGYGVGSIKIKGSSLGVAAVLFVGLIFGALDKSIQLPNILLVLGLSVFVYNIGLSSGPSFFASFKKGGAQTLLFVVAMLTFSALLAVGLHYAFGFSAAVTAGLFAGSSTNTAALAGVLDTMSGEAEGEALNQLLEETVVGYSLSYPMGVLGVMIAILIMKRLLRIDFKKEAYDLRKDYPVEQNLINQTILIKNEAITNRTLRDLMKQYKWTVVFGRLKRGEEVSLINWDTQFQLNDVVRVTGAAEQLEEMQALFGEEILDAFTYDQKDFEMNRVFVSNPDVAGQTLASLDIPSKYSAVITRVKRGDIDSMVNSQTIFELGDRVRFISKKEDMPALVKLFGDSYHSLSQINLLSFGLGMALGLLLGKIVFTLPGGINFQLGYAGGPLIVGLILGSLRRTGPIVWTLPYSANLTLRQFALILLLAVIGVRSGHTLFTTIMDGGAGLIFWASVILTITTAMVTLWVGYTFLKIPFTFLMGMTANQPAILDFSIEQSKNQLPTVGYSIMFPIALIIKIVYAQVLFSILY